MKVQITLDDELMKQVDDYVDRHFMSRSAVFSFAVSQLVNSDVAINAVVDMAASMKKIADTGVLDDETMKKFEDYERLLKMCLGRK